jgi:uncharacterized protein (TIGR03083 family)
MGWEERVGAFGDAARWFVASVGLVDDRWEAPGLGGWDVRALVGHTSRSLLTVETYLAQPAEAVDTPTAVEYYRRLATAFDDPAVEQRSRDAGAALGADPAGAVAGIADRVLGLVGTCSGDELVTTLAGGMRLADYLPTRTVELVVHTCDLHRALDTDPHPPAGAAGAVLRLVGDLAVTGGRAADLLLAATGREPLPAGFSVLHP